jgi:WG repeat protein
MRGSSGIVRLAAAAGALVLAAGAWAGEEGPLFRVLQGGKWGYIDRAGRQVVAPRFDRADDFSEGLAAVQLGDTFGYVDVAGRLVLVPVQQRAGTLHRPFSDGLALVRQGRLFGYVDRTGRVAIPLRYVGADDFSEGYALACSESGCGYVDREGQGVIPDGYMGSAPIKGGIACVTIAMGMSRRRVALHVVRGGRIAGDFEGCGPASEGLVAVRVGEKWGYLDTAGRGVIPPRFEAAGEFSDGLAPAQEDAGRCGYVDRSGAFAIPPRFEACHRFSDGLARVLLAGAEGEASGVAFIDRSGRPVIVGADLRPPFDAAEDFVNGLAAVGQGGEPYLAGAGVSLGYVDRTGAYVWPPTR